MSDLVSEPELREVRGPSAIGGGSRRFFDLLMLMSVTEFKRVYFGTVLGYLWSLVRPLMLFGVLLFVFTRIIKIGGDVEHYPVILLFGIVLYTFFQEATVNAVTSVVAQEGVVRKTQFPRLVIPLAVVFTSAFNLAVNLVVVFVFILAFGVTPVWTWLLFPVALALLFVFTAAVSMLLSALYVRFRDVQIIWTVIAQVLLYATPVIYPLTFLSGFTLHLILLNPLTPIFRQVQVWVINPGEPSASSLAGGFVYVLPAIAIFIGVCILGVWVFNREAPRIAEDL